MRLRWAGCKFTFFILSALTFLFVKCPSFIAMKFTDNLFTGTECLTLLISWRTCVTEHFLTFAIVFVQIFVLFTFSIAHWW